MASKNLGDSVPEFIKNLSKVMQAVGGAVKQDYNKRANEVGTAIVGAERAKESNPVLDFLSGQKTKDLYTIGNTISMEKNGSAIDPRTFLETLQNGGNLEDLTVGTNQQKKDNTQYAPGTAVDPYSTVTMNNKQAEGLQAPGLVSELKKNAGKNSPAESDEDVIEYTYKRGDTFGQVIKDLGLETGKGLWGSNGDVAYYTKQLRQQGIPGMVPIGTKIRLRRRK